MEQRITKSAATAVATGAGMWIASAVVGKIAHALGVKSDNARAAQKTTFVLGMVGAGVIKAETDHAYATACIALGAGYGLHAVAVAVMDPLPTGNAGSLSSGAPMLETRQVGTDAEGVPVYQAEYV